MINSLLYQISSKVAQILNLYFNDINIKFPFTVFSVLEDKRTPKVQIISNLKVLNEIVKSANLSNFFNINLSKSIEENLVQIVKGYGKYLEKFSVEAQVKKYKKQDLKVADLKNLYGISGEEKELHILFRYLHEVKKYFKIILVNGSIGSRDYKPGWSDIDLFIIIKKEYLTTKENLKKLRKITLTIKKIMYRYCILQLHGVFYSSEFHMNANYNEFFPIACLETGQVITELEDFQLLIPSNRLSAINYYKTVSNGFRDLYYKNKIRTLPKNLQILLFHRIYSFPFTFLQCFNYNIGKKEAFSKIKDDFRDSFPNISEFYEEFNKFYQKWEIKKIRTYKIRKYLSYFFSIRFLNKFFINFENEITCNIKIYFKNYCKRGYFEDFLLYLDKTDIILKDKFPEYNNLYKPYLKNTFYQETLKKISKVFSENDELSAIYQFGSISAPGNSDIDLIFIIKDNISFFNNILKTIKTKFTQDEQFIIFQHNPFVIPLKLAKYINFIRPCSNLKRIFGHNIEFEKVENPHTKFAIFVELLIFTTIINFPSSLTRIEDLIRPLQNINTIKYVLNLFLELKQEFNIDSIIEPTPINEILEQNDVIRKSMYQYDVDKIKSHINHSFIVLNNFLFNLKLEVANFIEKDALKGSLITLKNNYPMLKFSRYFFISNEKQLSKIYMKRLAYFDDIKNYYQPWAFYFFFQRIKMLKKPFFDGVNKRNYYLFKYLNYTTHNNNRNNLYVPFWYLDLNKQIFPKLWNIFPKSMKHEPFFYFYFWQFIRKSLLFFRKTLRKESFLLKFIEKFKNKLRTLL